MDGLISCSSSIVPILKENDSAESIVYKKMKVYIWDMDETLILLTSLLNGSYAQSFNGSKNALKGVEIGKMWEKYILQLCDDYFFYEQIENYNEPFLEALRQYDDGRDLCNYDFAQDGFGSPAYDDLNKKKQAYRHRFIAQKYQQGLRGALDQELVQILDELYELTDNYTDGWLSAARSFLEECSVGGKDPLILDSNDTKVHHVNILVTSGSLIPSLVKCLLFRFDNLITHENVYSSWEVGKLQCFSWIKERFSNPNIQFCVIGDGIEECEAAQTMKWPFVKIDMIPGSLHKFPGLTLRTVGYYFSVVYGNSEDAKDDER